MLSALVVALSLLCALVTAVPDSFTIVKVKDKYPVLVDFRLRMPDLPNGVQVFITNSPSYGRLLKVDGKSEIVGGSVLGNRLVYVVNNAFPEAGSDSVTETVPFYYMSDETPRVDSQFSIVIKNPRLSVRNLTFRAVNLQPRKVQLVVREYKQKKALTLADNGLLQSVKVFPPSGDCLLSQLDGTAITDPVDVTDPQLRVTFVLGSSGSSCSFNFIATGSNLLDSDTGKVQLNAIIGGKPPRAYSTKATLRLAFDESRSIEFIGSTTNPNTNLSFWITSPPQFGKLFFVTDIANVKRNNFITFAELPTKIYSGPATRIVLVYRPDASKIGSLTNGTAVDTIKFQVRDNYKTSSDASVTVSLIQGAPPKCGPLILSPVFWDRPYTNIILNYRAPNGFSIQKLILLTAPRNAVGELMFSRKIATKDMEIVNTGKANFTAAWQPLRPGQYFTDRQKRLSYVVRPGMAALARNETYTYRAMNFQGLSCIGSVTFEVMPHNQVMLPGASRAVRRELVRVNDITLLPLWGDANKSLGQVTSAVIVSAPRLGTLFTVTGDAPYDPFGMYRVRGLTGVTYCRRHRCEKYLGTQLAEGATVNKVELWVRDGNFDSSGRRLFVFYKSPPSVESLQTTTDSFEYSFVGTDGTKSTLTQRVVINFKKAKKRIIEVTYKVDPAKRWTNYSEQPETLVKCVVSNMSNQVVAIEEFDMYRRHNKKVDFRLFQAREEGNRLVLAGDRLAPTNKFGLDAQWLEFGNSVILIPGARSRRQVYQFRARIYNLTAYGQVDKNVYEIVRVVIRRENNVPVWISTPNDVRQEMFVGETKSITIQAYDADDDLLSFRVSQGVSFGILRYQETRFGATTSTVIKTGAVLRIPKGSPFRAQATLFYTAVHAEGKSYPLEDYFSVYADDGGGVLSERLIVNITQVSDISELHSKGGMILIPTNVVVYGAIGAIGAIVFVVVMFRRRSSRAKYMGLPTNSEMQSVNA